MKKIIIVICLLVSINVNSQTLSTDSLSIIIRTLQKQVSALQAIAWQHTITFAPSQFIVSNTPDSLHQTIAINPIYSGLSTGTLAVKDSTNIVLLQNKIAALKATSITTTVIQ